MFNDFFVSSIIELNRSIPITPMNNIDRDTNNNTTLKFEQINIDTIDKAMKHVKRKVNKSDLLNSNVWCDAMDYCGYFFMRIINETIQTGYFPKAWKLSTVTPIPKVTNTK